MVWEIPLLTFPTEIFQPARSRKIKMLSNLSHSVSFFFFLINIIFTPFCSQIALWTFFKNHFELE